MKKNKKSLLLTVILAVVMVFALSLGAYAAQSDAVSKDGLTAQLFTDKNAYEANESVAVTVRVDNQTGKEVSIVTTINVPESVKLANEVNRYEADLKAGETWTTPEAETDDATTGSEAETDDATTGSEAETDDATTGSEAETDDATTGSEAETDGAAGGDVETGDNMKARLWIILAVLSVGTIIALLAVGKNRKTWISMLLCLIMVGGLSATAISAQAADLSGEIQLSCTISVDGKDEVVTATVSYVIHDVDEGTSGGEAVEMSDRLEALIALAENALLYSRNLEGAAYPQLFVNGIDPVTKEAPIWNKFTDDKTYVSGLYKQTNFLKMLEGLTEITGEDKYAQAAYDQIQVRYDTPGLVDDNGLFYSGGHTILDVMTGKHVGYLHESKDYQLPLELYYKVDPEAFERFVIAYWNAHVRDFSDLSMNRHGIYNAELRDWKNIEYTDPSPYVVSEEVPFLNTANDLIEAAYYLSIQTDDPIYMTWAERLLDKYIAVTDKETGLSGSVYGRQYVDDYDATDRWIYNFAGADFVDARGVDYKTLTEEDYAICGETMKIDRNSLKSSCGYGPQIFIPIYEQTGNEKFYDFVKGNMLGLVRYIYDPEIHKLNTPMSTNGTDFNPGGDGPVLKAPRGGYYLNAGKSFAVNERTFELILKSLIDTVHMLKDEDAAERVELWAAARAWAQNMGLGDIGTAMGENVNVNLETTSVNAHNVMAVLSLYKYTGHQQYYDLAVKMADNILKSYFDEETGLFRIVDGAPYVLYDTEEMYAVFCVEAMTRGMIDEISLDLGHSASEVVHSGMGDVDETKVFYNRVKVDVIKVELDAESYSLVLDQDPNLVIIDVSGHADERAIRQMVALGVMDIDADGKFAPDATVTRAELVQMVMELFGFDNAEGLIDENLGGAAFDGNKIASREEMASIIVRALKKATPEKTYYVANSLYRIEDADSIADWARDYADIATNYRLMVDITEDVFSPKAEVTRAMVADALQNLCRYYEVEGLESLTATVTPYNADSQIVTWTTSDNTVVEVDQQGRLYPLKAGEAVITATADTQSAQIKVIVAAKEDWMIKEVTFNGESLAGFNACTREYDVNLLMGTTQIPTITAVSFSGVPVEVKLPETLPGIAELNVQGHDEKYTINVDNTFIDYAVNQNFDFEAGTLIQDVVTDRYNWRIQGNAKKYVPYWTVVSTDSVNSDAEDIGCASFPYRHELGVATATLRLELGGDYAYTFGADQDDMLLVVELDIAVKNMDGKAKGFNIYFNEKYANGSKSFARFNITDNQIKRRIDSETYKEDTIQTIEDNRFYNLKFVVDKKTGTFSYYFDGELLEKDVAPFSAGVTGFGILAIDVTQEAADCDAEVFFDNVKIYELQKCVVEDTLPQEPAEPAITGLTVTMNGEAVEMEEAFAVDTLEYTVKLPVIGVDVPLVAATCSDSAAEVTVVQATEVPGAATVTLGDKIYTVKFEYEYLVKESYNDETVGTLLGATGNWGPINQYYEENTKIVARPGADGSSTDNCFVIGHTIDSGKSGTFRLNIDPVTVGESADGNLLVVSMDVRVSGDAPTALIKNGLYIALEGTTISTYVQEVRAWVKPDATIALRDAQNSNAQVVAFGKLNEWVKLTMVLNKKAKTADYYIGDTLLNQDYSYSGATGVTQIEKLFFFTTGTASTAFEFYFDNLEVYEITPAAANKAFSTEKYVAGGSATE